jgi:hypothetical protein
MCINTTLGNEFTLKTFFIYHNIPRDATETWETKNFEFRNELRVRRV